MEGGRYPIANPIVSAIENPLAPEERNVYSCNTISLKCMCIDCVNQVKKLRGAEQEVLFPRKVGGARCPAYGVSERYSKDIICTIIQAKWYKVR